jgi:RimJ/RimL family protein N-acetyltransferase
MYPALAFGKEDLMIEGQRIRLRRATLDDADAMERWQTVEYMGKFNDFGMPWPPVRKAIQETGLVGENGGTLIVESAADRTPIGTVSWRTVRYGPNPESAAWNIGISLVPEARGKGFGTEAQRVLADHLLATTPIHRVEAMTDIDNEVEQRSLEKAGFAREGVLKGSQYRAGAWHDLVVFARVRGQ